MTTFSVASQDITRVRPRHLTRSHAASSIPLRPAGAVHAVLDGGPLCGRDAGGLHRFPQLRFEAVHPVFRCGGCDEAAGFPLVPDLDPAGPHGHVVPA